MKKLIVLSTFLLLIAFCSCEFSRSLEGEEVNLMSNAGRTSDYKKYGKLYLYSAYLDLPIIEDTTGSYIPPLALAANRVALTNLNGIVTVLTGKNPEWIAQLDSNAVAMSSMAADKEQNLYLIANNDVLYSFSKTGELRWKKYFPRTGKKFIVYSDLLAQNDGIVLGSSSGLLVKLDHQGNILWEKMYSTAISRTFSANSKGELIIPLTHQSYGKTDTLLCLDAGGNKLWSWQKNKFRILSFPVVTNEYIFIVGTVGQSNEQINLAMALDMKGKLIWEKEINATPRFLSADDDNRIYIISYNLGLGKPITIANCFTKDGELEWEKYFETTAYSQMIIGNEYICFSGRKPTTSGVYFLEKNGEYVKTVSLSNLPDIVMKPDVKPDGVIIFAGSSRFSVVRIDDIWINKIIPW
jgi:outer membrane protein assembly factor BamB